MQLDNHTFYKQAILKYGITARGVHWNSKFSQYVRFEVISKYINQEQNISIIDAGCGFAEYLNFLQNRKLYFKSYIGIDCEEHMIQISKTRFPNYKFYKLDVLNDKLPFADYYICSGAMNLLTQVQMKNFIKNCFFASNKGFIFNFLKTHSFTNINKDDILSYCKKLSNKVSVEDNYLENDCTIFLEK